MDTPICDFVNRYIARGSLRMHMPGHKGASLLGMEPWDITEISGADSLYEADGIIRESEMNASRLFGCHTFYSTEGSSLVIRAMLYLVLLYAKENGKRPMIAAGRNVHKTFLSGAALLDLEVKWLYPADEGSYLSCLIDAQSLKKQLLEASDLPAAVYLTSPDYLGNCADIAGISRVCHELGILLIVDHAHGAYRKFLPVSQHPMDLGADMCSDSAHKTLPVLTGGAYLHISHHAPRMLEEMAKSALALFGSTSPSYLILQSLDRANAYLDKGYRENLQRFCATLKRYKAKLEEIGYAFTGDEGLKLTFLTKDYGYTGTELQKILNAQNVECEFADPDHLVLMLTPENGEKQLETVYDILKYVPKRIRIDNDPPKFHRKEQVLSVREAMFSPQEKICVENSIGRVLASPSVSCPPAVPVLMCGERIDEAAVQCFRYYGINTCSVVK